MEAVTRYVFEQLHLRAVKTVPCSGNCGRTVRRQRTFTMTINPWNVNDAGEPASRVEIMEKLRAEAAAWQGSPESHGACTP